MPRNLKPDFRLSIENLFFVHDATIDETIFVFSALLVNRGAASVALSWEAMLTVNDATVMLTRFCLVGDWVLSQGAQEVTIQPGDQLLAKTCERRVPRGGARVGRLFFKLAGDVTEHIQPGKFRVDVSLKDYLETKTSAVFGQETHVVNGPLPMYAHERSTVKDPEAAVPAAAVGPTTIQ